MSARVLHLGVPLLLACLAATPSLAAEAGADPLAWLAGSWCAGENGERIEETWLAPIAGESIGMSRTAKDGRATAFEFVRIARVDGVPTYLAQPGGKPATAFPRTDGGADWIRFENAAHDFPQRIEYRRQGESLVATISGPGKGGKATEIIFLYARCAG